MEQIKKIKKKYLPNYALKAMILALAVNFMGYNGVKFLVPYLKLKDMSFGFEESIPFLPIFIYIYLGAFAQWIIGYLRVARQEKAFVYETISAEIYAKIICIICFIFLPCTLARPEITGTDFTSRLTSWMYRMDSPYNLFPSLHCLESWFCVRTAFMGKNYSKLYKTVSIIFTLLVFISTLVLKQHVLVDVFAGVLVYEIGLKIAKRKPIFK